MNNKIGWIEIPAQSMKRAISFYEKLLKTTLDVQILLDKPIAILNENMFGVGGCIIEKEKINGLGGIRPVLCVDIMHEAIENVENFGGKVIVSPTLLKQKNGNGDFIIGKNLIDSQVGYICEIMDSEGNGLLLYSHS